MVIDNFISGSFLEEPEFNSDDLFKFLESLEDVTQSFPEKGEDQVAAANNIKVVSQKPSAEKNDSSSSSFPSKKRKRNNNSPAAENSSENDGKKNGGQQNAACHITVERNRRKQMNEHLAVLRSLMPCFYVKRGDQASIIGGVVDYIKELQQVLQSLEAKKQRRVVYSEVVLSSPRLVAVSSPRLLAPSSPLISPKKPPLSPRLLNLPPISPRTPQPTSPYKPRTIHQQSGGGYLSPTTLASTNVLDSSLSLSTSLVSNDVVNSIGGNELVASSKSSVADVEVKFCGANLLLNTVSRRIPGQAAKIVAVLEGLSLEILQVSINTVDYETVLNSFTIKIGIECQVSAEELAHEIQQTF